ncbi:hypothetical protein HPB47_014966 [Ixodes persulcatus]|uniref:Uncharacterized protein n=1 Tax=Ixodes persulcatus TaxID=34615 RepID=A0AC60QY89_IXOPE|nr:hypothetical protein HPB47_014966 [Ixodes persulcatus]
MASAMRLEVEGEKIMPEEVSKKFGWRVAGQKKTQGQERKLSLTPVNAGPAAAGHRRPQRKHFKSKLRKAARMPVLPKQDIKIVMRPRGGLNIGEVSTFEISRAIVAAANVSGEEVTQDLICPNKQQNIVVVSTHKRENADRYWAVRSLTINGMVHEVSAYETAPHGTVKGVIRGVLLTDTIQEINNYIVQDYNPTAMQANRIAKTTTVVIAFDGDKVPNYIKYGNLLIECSLYRKQIDMCYRCGRLGHQMDVCPNPKVRICRGCGMKNPEESHACSNPKCSLCGCNHLTADKECKARFKTLYVVRKRRWERQQREDEPIPDKVREKQERYQVTIVSRSSQARISFEVQVEDPAERRRREIGGLGSGVFHKECRHCLELKDMIERQNNQIKSQNNQIEAIMKRTSTVRDTTPDLTLVRGNLDVTWRNTGENLGSDHDITCVTLRVTITDWDRLRRSADSEGEDEDEDSKTYEAWAKK